MRAARRNDATRAWHDRAAALVLASGVLTSAPSCGPAAHPVDRRGAMMDTTKAGQDRCVLAKSHDRPFIIEWDATDLAAFEARAARDVVFVRYEGCVMTVIDGCRDDAVAGRFGVYAPPTFTSGSVESIDIRNQDTLYAELPLGARKLEARVGSGEALHLRYAVSGVATASRDVVHRDELASIGSCAAATHVVWAINIGAFELQTQAQGASASSLLKRGGNLDTCTAGAVGAGCRMPIRLALRPIDETPSPKVATATAAKAGESADELRDAAKKKKNLGDGAACLSALDRADAIDPLHVAKWLDLRAICQMMAGKCDEGRATAKKFLGSEEADKVRTAAQIDEAAMYVAARYCPDPLGTPEERAIRAEDAMEEASRARNGRACVEASSKLIELSPLLDGTTKRDGARTPKTIAGAAAFRGIRCAAHAKLCTEARALYSRWSSKKLDDKTLDDEFLSWMSPDCGSDEWTPPSRKKKP